MPDGPTFFATAAEFRRWLQDNHADQPEVSVGFYKKSSGLTGITYPEARDEALCFGWIDGRLNRIDERSHRIRFTPRRPGSNWSNVNIKRMEELEAEGRMTTPGREAFAERREDRSGVYSFEREEEAELPPEFEQRLRANSQAAEFFYAQPPGYRRTAIHLVISAKRPETRERRMRVLIEDSAQGLRIKQLRR